VLFWFNDVVLHKNVILCCYEFYSFRFLSPCSPAVLRVGAVARFRMRQISVIFRLNFWLYFWLLRTTLQFQLILCIALFSKSFQIDVVATWHRWLVAPCCRACREQPVSLASCTCAACSFLALRRLLHIGARPHATPAQMVCTQAGTSASTICGHYYYHYSGISAA